MSNTIYYGKGHCSLEANDVKGLTIKYKGGLSIIDKTSNNYYIIANSRKILIFPFGKVEPLTDLFEYQGEFKITSVEASNRNGENVVLSIIGGFDYTQLINTKIEDMTTETEHIKSGYIYRRRINTTVVDKKIIKDQYSDGELYLSDGKKFTGSYHIHLGNNGVIMTGSEHTETSENLYRTKRGDG